MWFPGLKIHVAACDSVLFLSLVRLRSPIVSLQLCSKVLIVGNTCHSLRKKKKHHL